MDILNFNTWLKDQWEKTLLVPKETRDYLTWESSENIRPEPSSFGITSKTWQQEEIVVHVYRDASKTRWWNPPKKKCLAKWGMLGFCVDLQSSISSIKIGLDKCQAFFSPVFIRIKGGMWCPEKPIKKNLEPSSRPQKNGSDLQCQVGFRGKRPVNAKNLIQKK